MIARPSRRQFLHASAGTVALSAAACAAGGEDRMNAGGPGHKADHPLGDMCPGSTGADALGPYWTSNVVETTQLATPTEAGQRLLVFGTAYASDCLTPLPGATVVAWQADDDGLYDYNHAGLDQGSAQGQLAQSQTRLRGMTRTTLSGTFAFDTIFPREYPLNLLDPASSALRAPHIHFAVFFTDGSGQQHQLVTQMYFEPVPIVVERVPDLDALNAGDGGASTAEATRFASVVGDHHSVWRAQFDIVLPVAPAQVP